MGKEVMPWRIVLAPINSGRAAVLRNQNRAPTPVAGAGETSHGHPVRLPDDSPESTHPVVPTIPAINPPNEKKRFKRSVELMLLDFVAIRDCC
jgi:hypothetical protein